MNNKFYRIDQKRPTIESLINRGMVCYRVKDMFIVHAGSGEEKKDYQVISTADKSLIINILLEGKIEFSYEDLKFQLDAKHEPYGVVVNLTRPTSFKRKTQKNNYISKLKIVVSPAWIDDRIDMTSNIKNFMEKNLTNFTLEMTKELVNLAVEIIHLNTPSSMKEKINLEILTLSLLQQVFEQITGHHKQISYKEVTASFNTINNKNTQKSLDNLLLYIEENLSHNLTIKDLAKYSCMSESSLHKKFKDTLDCTIQSYIKYRKLEVAKQYLETHHITVNEAAYNAGYKHPSNFTKAFKKTFGYTPSSKAKDL